MKYAKTIVAIVASVQLSAFAYTWTDPAGREWSYRVVDDEASITGVSPASGEIAIPSSVNGYVVTSIRECAFDHGKKLTSVTIPGSVTNIGTWAFNACIGLTHVTIGSSETIGNRAMNIGAWAFSGCSGLESVTIGNNVTNIGYSAFSGCSSLTGVTIPDSVTSIEPCAFDGCNSLESVTIPDSVTSIGWQAFYDCSSLTSVIIPDSVTSIGDRAFYGCSGLASVTIGSSEEIGNRATNIGDWVFFGCSGLARLTIGNNVTNIGCWAFSGCSSLASVTIGSGVKRIEGHAFSGCSKLASVTIPDSVTDIEVYAFEGCSGLTSVTIPSSVTYIGGWVFDGCSRLARVYVSAGDANRIKKKMAYWLDAKTVSFIERVRVVFDANGGTLYGTAKVLVEKGTAIGVMPMPFLADCAFLGWFTAANGGTKVTATTRPTSDVVYYAHWRFVGKADEAHIYINTQDSYQSESDGVFALGLSELVESYSEPKLTIKGLPAGLKFDAKTMVISGKATQPGVYNVTVSVTNATVKQPVVATFELVVPNLTDGLILVDDLYGPYIPGVSYTTNLTAAAGCTVSGLPAGLKWTAKDTTVSGAPTKPGSYTVTFTKTVDRVKHVATATFVVAAFPKLTINVDGAGKVTGAGDYAANKKVALKATADKNSVFTGWYDGDDLLSQAASYSFVMPETDKMLMAKFISVAEDKDSIRLDLGGEELAGPSSVAPVSLATNVMCGVALEWPLSAFAYSAKTITVAGLPAGLKFTAKDIVDAKTKAVTVPANTIYGAPTTASAVDKKTGLPKPSDVKITVTTAGKSSVTYLVKLTVDPLPAWAVGSFEGPAGNGSATMSVTAAGKVAGKFALGGTNWTFKADSYAAVE
ncbi:MAG: leucine-rich repeat protein, partial [Kiritimatiellae bacterium]|nr:leucine-rich repeat protein [Kiritimatiellia bacterium]